MTDIENDLRIQLAACYRLVSRYKMSDLIFTHISVRIPGPEHHFLINPYGLLFDEIKASNLVKIDLNGDPVEPTKYRTNPAGFLIHSAIHSAREDAKCVLHTHTQAGCAIAAQAGGLLPLNQMSLMFYNDIGYHEYEGVALNLDEQSRLVRDLGNNSALILRNHGLLTVGSSIGEAFLRIFYLEKACQIQIAAQSGGRLNTPSEATCRHTYEQINSSNRKAKDNELNDHNALALAWDALLREVDRYSPGYKD